MAPAQAQQNGLAFQGKRSDKQHSVHFAARLPVNATASAATEPADAPPHGVFTEAGSQSSAATSTRNNTDLVQLSKLPASPVKPSPMQPALAPRSPNSPPDLQTTGGRAVSTNTTARPPPDLEWNGAMERLIMNSTKQVEAIEQVGYQAVTVALRALPALHKLKSGAATGRDYYGTKSRLAMRRAALAELMNTSNVLLSDLAYLYSLLGKGEEAGQHGRTHARRIDSLLKDLVGGQKDFSNICKEMKLAGRFLLMREPTAGLNPELEDRANVDGQRDTRQLDSVLRAVMGAQNSLGNIWGTLSALQAAGVTPSDPAWPLLKGLDISTAADVLATLQLDGKPKSNGALAPPTRSSQVEDGMNPPPQESPSLGRPWLKSLSGLGRSPARSPAARASSSAAVYTGCTPSRSNSMRSASSAIRCLGDFSDIDAWEARQQLIQPGKEVSSDRDQQLVDNPVIQIRPLRNGDIYRGEILRSEKTGMGQLQYANRDVYEGHFENDTMHGYGVYSFASGGLYQGQWEDGCYCGLGVETFPAGGTYHGEFSGGQRSGWGVASFANGDYYEGEWQKGNRHGRGMQQGADHSSFVGDYAGGKRSGYGCYTFGNGDRYMGEYRHDVPDGYGVYLFASGHTYEGQWKSGSKHGWCLYSLANGQQWAGQWEMGRPKWLQNLAAAQVAAATAETSSSSSSSAAAVEAVQHALDAAANARKAGSNGAARFTEHWQPEGHMQVSVRQATNRAVAAAEAATGVQDVVASAVNGAIAAAEHVSAAKR